MNYHEYYQTDVLNGEGIRNVLFVSGCIHGCRGCYNQSTWSPDSGQPFTKELEEQIIADLQDTRIDRNGITFSGGDPLHELNIPEIIRLVRRIRIEAPTKNIWMWTGYTLEEINSDKSEIGLLRSELAHSVDVIVDGRFERDKHHPSLKFRGSWNQKIYEMPAEKDVTPNDIPDKEALSKRCPIGSPNTETSNRIPITNL